MSDYDRVYQCTWGSGTDTDDCLRVQIFGESSISRDDLDIAYDAIFEALEQIYNDDERAPNVDYAQVMAYETDEDLPCDESEHNDTREDRMNSHVTSWLADHSFREPGCYLWLADCGVARGWDGAWSSRSVALVGTSWYSGEELGAMAIHESLHTYINHGCDDVSDRTDGNEHQLGTVTSYDNVTPLAASYEDGKKYHEDGNCNSYANPTGNTNWLSGCTRRSVGDSLEHKNAWFHDQI